MDAGAAKTYLVFRLDREKGIWADLPGVTDFRDLTDAKAAARSFHGRSGDRYRVEDNSRKCYLDTKFDVDEEIARLEAMGS